MRSGGSKQKGASFERKICRDLSLWISNRKHSDVFWRSAMSGGRSTVGLKRGERLSAQAGDISAVHSLGQRFIDLFMVEVKHYRILNYYGLITGRGNLVEFWSRAKSDAAKHDKCPLLIAKQNNYPPIACTDRIGERRLLISSSLNRIRVHHLGMTIILYEDFLEINPTVLER